MLCLLPFKPPAPPLAQKIFTLLTSANVIRYPVRRKPVSSVNGSQLRVMHTGVTFDDTIRRSPGRGVLGCIPSYSVRASATNEGVTSDDTTARRRCIIRSALLAPTSTPIPIFGP